MGARARARGGPVGAGRRARTADGGVSVRERRLCPPPAVEGVRCPRRALEPDRRAPDQGAPEGLCAWQARRVQGRVRRDEFTKKVCRPAAKCAIAGGFTLWAGVQTGQPAWQAEIAAFNACWAAIATEFVP